MTSVHSGSWRLLVGFFLLLWAGVALPGAAQSSISLHPLVDTSRADVRQAVAVWVAYLRSRPDSLYDNPYWNAAEKARFGAELTRFDLLEREFDPTLYRGYPVQVLSVVRQDGGYQIKSLFGGNNPRGRSPLLVAITNVYARPESGIATPEQGNSLNGTTTGTGGRWYLYNALPINRDKHWQGQRVGYVQYYFPPYHAFDRHKARQLNAFIEEVCRNFALSLPGQPIEYYLADTADELRQLRGIDYEATLSGTEKPTGRAIDNRVFCSGLGEFYPHEVIHVLLTPHFPNQHPWVAEGVATWLGGSRGQPLVWHLQRTAAYLKQHPEIDLSNLLTLHNMDEYTDYRYAIGGLLCQRVYQKGGYPLVKQFMNTGRSDAAFYQAIEAGLGIDRTRLNAWLRDQLAAYL